MELRDKRINLPVVKCVQNVFFYVTVCDRPPDPPINGKAQTNLSENYFPRDKITYECNEKSFTSNTTTVTCGSNRKWTPSELKPCIQTRK